MQLLELEVAEDEYHELRFTSIYRKSKENPLLRKESALSIRKRLCE